MNMENNDIKREDGEENEVMRCDVFTEPSPEQTQEIPTEPTEVASESEEFAPPTEHDAEQIEPQGGSVAQTEQISTEQSTEQEQQIENDPDHEPQVIISLTSFPARIEVVHYTIETLLMQTRPADKIVLWLAQEQFPEGVGSLPTQLLNLRKRGLEIEWCSDLKSYKKLIPALKKYPQDIIITCDDDILYPIDMVETLMERYSQESDCVWTMRTHLMQFAETGEPLPYKQWMLEYSGLVGEPRMALFATTGAGTLFPPHCLPDEALNSEKFMQICPYADDVWVNIMLTAAATPVALAAPNTKLQYIEGTQKETLWAHNLDGEGNDPQIAAVLQEYANYFSSEMPLVSMLNDLGDYVADEKLCMNAARKGYSYVNEKCGVKVSIIIPAYNCSRALHRFLESACRQSMEEIELICINDGSTDDTYTLMREYAKKDARVMVISNSERHGKSWCRRQGVLRSRGEYIYFAEPDGVLAPDACENIYKRAEECDADIYNFTCGVIPPHSTVAPRAAEITPYVGKLVRKDMLTAAFSDRTCGWQLWNKLFSGRISRKAMLYVQDEFFERGNDMYCYMLLAWSAIVFVGEETPVYYGVSEKIAGLSFEPCNAEQLELTFDRTKMLDCAAQFIELSGEDKTSANIYDNMHRISAERSVSLWGRFGQKAELSDGFDKIAEKWGEAYTAAALHTVFARSHEQAADKIYGAQSMLCRRREVRNIGVVTAPAENVSMLYSMCETADVLNQAGYNVSLVGAGKEVLSSTVQKGRVDSVGGELYAERTDIYKLCRAFAQIIDDNPFDMLIIPADNEYFLPLCVAGRLLGLPVIAYKTEQFGCGMLLSEPNGVDSSALKLASLTVVVTDDQRMVLSELGVKCRTVELPSVLILSGRSTERETENAIVWSGCAREAIWRCRDMVEIFERVRRSVHNAALRIYIDCADTEDPQLAALENMFEQNSGVAVKRLRPDYGIYDGAAVQLITRSSAACLPELRAGSALGVPTVMYHTDGRAPRYNGVITVMQGDTAAAADSIIKIMNDKELRSVLSDTVRKSMSLHDAKKSQESWRAALNEAARSEKWETGPATDAHTCEMLEPLLKMYSRGAHINSQRMDDYEQRCADYEARLVSQAERYEKELYQLTKEKESAENQKQRLQREKEGLEAQLADVLGSTSYKTGSAITLLPRKLKNAIRSLTGDRKDNN